MTVSVLSVNLHAKMELSDLQQYPFLNVDEEQLVPYVYISQIVFKLPYICHVH